MLGLGLLLLPAVCGATPDPDANPRNLLRHLPAHRHARYDLSQPPPHPTASLVAQGKPKPKPTCPPEYAAEAAKSGMISVGSFLNSSRDDPGKEHVDDAPAVRAAITTAANCSASVFFPPGGYSLHTTVVLPGDIELRGSGLGSAEFNTEPGATISGPPEGPAFLCSPAILPHLRGHLGPSLC